MKTIISVKACNECPFFERHVMSQIADLVMKRETKSGTCKFSAAPGQPFPMGRMTIVDERLVPDLCPLRRGEITVELAK